MSGVIKIAVAARATLPYNKLEPFQGELKTLSKEEYQKIRESIIRYGFSFAVHVWKQGGKNYIIDGHQRVFTVKQMVEVEGFKCPNLPVAYVVAKSFKEAKLKVLAGVSTYGKVNEKGFIDFVGKNKLEIEAIAAQFDIPDIDINSVISKLSLTEEDTELPPPEATTKGMQSSSAMVKQVQLFFQAEQYEEFMKKIKELESIFKTENITDTVMEAVRAAYRIKKTVTK